MGRFFSRPFPQENGAGEETAAPCGELHQVMGEDVTLRLLHYLETLVFVNTTFHNRNCACSVFSTVPVLGGTM